MAMFPAVFVARVVAAHDALQLGEPADHVGQQVGLGQAGGFQRLVPSTSRRCPASPCKRIGGSGDDGGRCLYHALRTPSCVPSFVVIDHLPRPSTRERSSCGPGREELASARRGAPRACCRRDDRAAGVLWAMFDDQELVGQACPRRPAAGSTSGWPSWSGSGTCGTSRKASSKRPVSTLGALDQRGDLVQQGVIPDGTRHPAGLAAAVRPAGPGRRGGPRTRSPSLRPSWRAYWSASQADHPPPRSGGPGSRRVGHQAKRAVTPTTSAPCSHQAVRRRTKFTLFQPSPAGSS